MKIDLLSDLHMHTRYSDGQATPAEMVEAALACGMQKIAITDHMPLPFEDSAGMQRDQLLQYREEITQLKRDYAGRIEILLSLEFDYLPNYQQWTKEILDLGWDFRPASVHFSRQEVGGKPVVMDSAEGFALALQELFDGDIQALCAHYYELIGESVATGWFEQVNHFDLIKKFNVDNCYFSDQAPWYQNLVEATLDKVKGSGMHLEINTAGLDKPVAEAYPANWIVERAKALGIPLCVNSDAHSPADIGRYFEQIKEQYS